jgi:DNA-directed RNA polymerase specialized sigma24 family protein
MVLAGVVTGVGNDHRIGDDVVTSLITAGAVLAAAAVIYPRLRSFDLGIFKVELGPDVVATRSVRTDVWRLQRFAWLVCGNATDARDLVEEALADTRSCRLPASERGIHTLKSLVALLENAREHAWLQPPAAAHRRRASPAEDVAAEDCRPTMEALAGLPVRVRMAYLLHCSWLLPLAEVVEIVAQTPSEVSEAVAQGREALKAAQ